MSFSIRQAFSQAPKPRASEITISSSDECQELDRFFSEFCSSTTSIDDLREHEMILFFGTNVSFRYFLQFYLEFSSQDLLNAGAIPDLIVESFSSEIDHLHRVDLFNAPEVECVGQYFDFLVERGECVQDDLIGARKTLERLKVWIELNKKK